MLDILGLQQGVSQYRRVVVGIVFFTSKVLLSKAFTSFESSVIYSSFWSGRKRVLCGVSKPLRVRSTLCVLRSITRAVPLSSVQTNSLCPAHLDRKMIHVAGSIGKFSGSDQLQNGRRSKSNLCQERTR